MEFRSTSKEKKKKKKGKKVVLNSKSLIFQAAWWTQYRRERYMRGCGFLSEVSKWCDNINNKAFEAAVAASAAASKISCNEGNLNQCRQNSVDMCTFFLLIEHNTVIMCYLRCLSRHCRPQLQHQEQIYHLKWWLFSWLFERAYVHANNI